MKPFALVAGLVLALGLQAGAQEGRCTSDVLRIKGTPVTVSYCVLGSQPGAGPQNPVRVRETYSSSKGSFTQTSPLQFISGDDPSRVIEDVSLVGVGLTGTLHLTLVMRGGSVHVEAAMLTPGAITIK